MRNDHERRLSALEATPPPLDTGIDCSRLSDATLAELKACMLKHGRIEASLLTTPTLQDLIENLEEQE